MSLSERLIAKLKSTLDWSTNHHPPAMKHVTFIEATRPTMNYQFGSRFGVEWPTLNIAFIRIEAKNKLVL